ncbi:response regulator [Paenibacillus abyssi]|uniref:AraC family transcriptional regulator n=1 Tax=Paenibacillus abyssi TaxID=1340531 RepID=A0A917G143_9BACL|nr:response regulator [Paenibacillus abyssi]GGG17196.1 AraC family transcriptional regulator [Paenibacillus abyssi]
MIKAILVDDEPMTRNGLRRFVDWGRIGIEIAGEAEDGIEAYEQFILLRPELVLCDVRMPRMDGIEFAQRIRQIDPDCKIIFLSGYNDVEYLKSAIKLKAVDYMLKPIQMAELAELLEETVKSIRASRSEQQELDAMRDQFDRSKPELMERLLKTILQLSPVSGPGYEAIEEDITRLQASFPLKGYYQCIVFGFQNDDARLRWKEEAGAEAASAGLPALTALVDGIGIACVALSSQRNDDRLGMWLNRLTRRKGQEEQQGVVAGAGDAFPHLNGCGTSYEQALKALSHRFYRGWNTVIWYNNLPTDSHQSGLFDKQAFIRFEELLRGKQLQAAAQWLDQIINELLLFTPMDVEAVRKKLFRWYVAMTRVYSETMWEFENDQLWATMFVSGELYTIRKFMMHRLDIIQEALEQTDSSDKTVIRDIIRFIQENYNKDVSINTVAGHVHLAPTYMCILFKKEKGVSINDYITQYRIEQAKRLLRDRKLKLYEVSAQVGYQDANYFAKVFRKLTGVIPSQYRDTLQED